jgi:hypothetical protein
LSCYKFAWNLLVQNYQFARKFTNLPIYIGEEDFGQNIWD